MLLSTGIIGEGLRLPALNPALFAVANATVYVLTYSVRVQPIATSIVFDGAGALWDVDPASFDVDFERGFLVEHMWGRRRLWRLAPPAAVFAVCNAVVGSVVWVIAAFAAVAVCSGKAPRTFGELLRKARSPLMVAAAANVAGTACVGAIAVSALPLATAFLLRERLPPALVLVDVVFVCAVYAAHRCVDFVCAVGVVVAAEEPGCDGAAAALRHAWRLAAMEPAEAASFVLVMPAVAGAASPFFVVVAAAAAASAPASVAWCALLGLVYVVVSGAAQVVSVCAVTVFYYECRLRCKEVDSLHSDEPDV